MSNEILKTHDGVSVVIGSYNRKNFLKVTIDTLRRDLEKAPFPHEIIVVDGGSSDGTLSWLSQQKDIITIIQHNRGTWQGKEIQRRSWGYFMNLGFKCSQYKYICMLSDDCLVVSNAVINGYQYFEQLLSDGQNIGAMAFYWRNWPDQEKYHVQFTLGNQLLVNHGMYLNKAIQSVGYIDEESYVFYHADGDLSLKLWQHGYLIIDSPDSFIEHYSHANRGVRKGNVQRENRDYENYLKNWEGIFYDRTNPVEGSQKERSFDDPINTWKKFRERAESLNDKIFRISHELKMRIKSSKIGKNRMLIKAYNKIRSNKD